MFNIFSSLFGNTSKGLDEILDALRPEKQGAPHGFGRQHRHQINAARHGGDAALRYTRQQERLANRRMDKALSVAKRGKAKRETPAGTGCAGFHRSNLEN